MRESRLEDQELKKEINNLRNGELWNIHELELAIHLLKREQ